MRAYVPMAQRPVNNRSRTLTFSGEPSATLAAKADSTAEVQSPTSTPKVVVPRHETQFLEALPDREHPVLSLYRRGIASMLEHMRRADDTPVEIDARFMTTDVHLESVMNALVCQWSRVNHPASMVSMEEVLERALTAPDITVAITCMKRDTLQPYFIQNPRVLADEWLYSSTMSDIFESLLAARGEELRSQNASNGTAIHNAIRLHELLSLINLEERLRALTRKEALG